jgi:hypothetical protein
MPQSYESLVFVKLALPLPSHVLGKRWQIYKDTKEYTVLANGMYSINDRYGNGLPLPISNLVDPSNVPPQKPLNSSQHPLTTKLPPYAPSSSSAQMRVLSL